jgi:hypothetical protein
LRCNTLAAQFSALGEEPPILQREGGGFSRIFQQGRFWLNPNALPTGGKKMKRLTLFCLIGAFLMASTVVLAQEKAPLGVGNLALKVDYIAFTDDELDDADVDSGVYAGIEGFGEVSPNLYLGLEVGYAAVSDGDWEFFSDEPDVELTYIPVEVNLKYAAEFSPHFIIDVGAGVSYNYAEIDVEGLGDEDEWLLGGQFFVDLNYTFDAFFLGINGKYQITEEFDGPDLGAGDDLDASFDNWRIGGQIGFFF